MSFATVAEEVSAYRRRPLELVRTSALEWWKKYGGEYPRLCVYALHILAIQATSTSAERAFSAAGRVMPKSRASTSPLLLNMILFVQQNDPAIKADRDERRNKRKLAKQRRRARHAPAPTTTARSSMSQPSSADPEDADDESQTDLSD